MKPPWFRGTIAGREASRLSIPQFTTNRLYRSRSGDWAVDRSDLCGRNNKPLYGRVWNDAADVGFELTSHRTGRCLLMLLSHTDQSEDEIHGWWFSSADGKFKMLVVND